MAEKVDQMDPDEKIVEIAIERLRVFENHPFRVEMDSQMKDLQDSIKQYGIITPVIVRPRKEGYYEIISGHRRIFAAEKLGYRKVPTIIRYMTDDQAVIAMVDKQEKAPQLYSLTALQRDANRFLTEGMESMIPDLAGKMAAKFGYTRKMVVHPKQVINNSKVSDHHAIIPTVNVADAEFGELPSGEQKVLSLITARLLSALGDPAVRNEVDVEFTCADTVFKAKAKNIREKGWRDITEWIMGSSAESTDSENDRREKNENADMLACIATLTNGKSYPLQNPKMEEGKTTPKKHFTDVIHFESRQWKYSKCKGAG